MAAFVVSEKQLYEHVMPQESSVCIALFAWCMECSMVSVRSSERVVHGGRHSWLPDI
jgi:hypothetical protein